MSNQTDGIFVAPVTEKESIEFFREGLKQASSAARQLASAQSHPIWDDISKILDEMHNNGMKLILGKPLSRQNTLMILDRREKVMSDKLDAERTPTKPKLVVN